MKIMHDFICTNCEKELKDVMCSRDDPSCKCPECGQLMDKDFSGFKGIRGDSWFRPSAARRKGKYKSEKKKPTRAPKRSINKVKNIKKPYNIREE
jgi:predicted nucleic acid-binding Zn ribbon protein